MNIKIRRSLNNVEAGVLGDARWVNLSRRLIDSWL